MQLDEKPLTGFEIQRTASLPTVKISDDYQISTSHSKSRANIAQLEISLLSSLLEDLNTENLRLKSDLQDSRAARQQMRLELLNITKARQEQNQESVGYGATKENRSILANTSTGRFATQAPQKPIPKPSILIKSSPPALSFLPRTYPGDRDEVISLMHSVNSSLMIVPINDHTLQVNRRRIVLVRHSDGSLVVMHKGVRIPIESFVVREWGKTPHREIHGLKL
jgi:hypothetical protein